MSVDYSAAGEEQVYRVACPDGHVWDDDEWDLRSARVNATYGDDNCGCVLTPHVVVRREPIRWTVQP